MDHTSYHNDNHKDKSAVCRNSIHGLTCRQLRNLCRKAGVPCEKTRLERTSCMQVSSRKRHLSFQLTQSSRQTLGTLDIVHINIRFTDLVLKVVFATYCRRQSWDWLIFFTQNLHALVRPWVLFTTWASTSSSGCCQHQLKLSYERQIGST